MTTLRSAVPHDTHLMPVDEQTITIPAATTPARVTMAPPELAETIHVDGIPVPIYRTGATTTVTNLPDPEDEVLIIVSRQVLEACPTRSDLVITNDAVRGPGGQIIGCRSLARTT